MSSASEGSQLPLWLVAFPKPSVDIPDLRGCGLFRPVFERPIKSRLVGAINADSARESDSPLPDSLSSLLFARPMIRVVLVDSLMEISVRFFLPGTGGKCDRCWMYVSGFVWRLVDLNGFGGKHEFSFWFRGIIL